MNCGDTGHQIKQQTNILLFVAIFIFIYFNICMIDKKYNEYYAPH